jgi:hypothetical protein
MIAKKYTDNNDNPQLKVLATTGTRQWIGTEQALDEAIAAGKIQPGTVADTYMEVDEPTVDYATVEYVRKAVAITPLAATHNEVIVADANGEAWGAPLICDYDGFITARWVLYPSSYEARHVVQKSLDGGATWTVAVSLGFRAINGNFTFACNKGEMYRVGISGTTQGNTWYVGWYTQWYNQRDYSE